MIRFAKLAARLPEFRGSISYISRGTKQSYKKKRKHAIIRK